MKSMTDRPFPCGHESIGIREDYRIVCPICRSFWDADFYSAAFSYSDAYAVDRMHYDPMIGRLKARALEWWLRRCGIQARGVRVCEVGYGGAYCLLRLKDLGADVMGIEAVEADQTHAVAIGIEPSRLYRFENLPERLPEPVELWLFLDSFEHLPSPMDFIRWALANSAPSVRILIVAPRADSASNRWLGRFWPHKVQDHPFHWSRVGLLDFFAKLGFQLEKEFHPVKLVSLPMVAAHWHWLNPAGGKRSCLGWLKSSLALRPLAIPFNIGEMGLLFAKRES